MANFTSFTQKLGAFSLATLLSRILGYVRDALVAATFGGGWLTDAFYAAFRVPNLLRRFLGEGSMTAAFVPIFTDVSHKKGKPAADHFLSALYSGLILVVITLVSLCILFAPQVAKMVAWGFVRNPEKFNLTVDLIRLISPFLLFISLAALLTAVLNSSGRFFIPALAPSGLSIGIILYILFVARHVSHAIYGLALAAVVGAAIHFIWQIPSLYKEGFHLKISKPFRHPEIKMFFILLGPTIIGLCSDQINLFVDQLCASFLRDGSLTALYNSNRIMQLPLALFGIAVSSVALPSLSKAATENNHADFKELLNVSLRIANYILIPSLIGLVVVGRPIVQFLFEHGRFTAEYTRLTFLALVPYSFGLPAYSAVKILASSFYAKKNTKTPVKVALIAMIIHVVGNIILMRPFQVAGLALSTALAGWIQALILYALARRQFGQFGGRLIGFSFIKSAGLGLIMGGVCLVLIKALQDISVMLLVPVVIGSGILVFLGFSKLANIREFHFLMDAIRFRKINI